MPTSVRISQQPDAENLWTLSRNPFVFRVRSTAYVTTPGNYWTRFWSVITIPVAGDTLVISGPFIDSLALGGDIVFAVVDDNAEPNEIERFYTEKYFSIAEWLERVVIPTLMSHEKLSEHFEFFRTSTNRIAAKAKKLGAAYTLTFSTTGTFDITPGTEIDGEDAELNETIMLRARLNVSTGYNSGIYKQSPWFWFDCKHVGSFGEVQVDMSEQLDQMIQGFDFPLDSVSFPYRPQNAARKVFVEWADGDAVTKVTTGSVRSDTYNVLKGGMRLHEYELTYLQQFNELWQTSYWITSRPDVIYTHARAMDYLHLHVLDKEETELTGPVVIAAKVYYNDGSSIQDTIYTVEPSSLITEMRQIVTVPCGFEQLGLDEWDAAVPYKYEIYILVSGGVNKKTFYLVQDTDMGCSLIYINQFGLPEGIWCEGERVTTVEHEREITDVARPIITGSSKDLMLMKSGGRSMQPMMSLVSVPLNSSEWRGHLGMLLSEQLWVVKDFESQPMAVQLVPGTVENETVNWKGNSALAIKLRVKMNAENGWSDYNKTLF